MVCHKRKKASLIVEASYMVPFTIFLYGILILLTSALLVRCLTSQNEYLNAHREWRYTKYDQNQTQKATGEVIYAERMRK